MSTNRGRKSHFCCLKNVAPQSQNIFLRLCIMCMGGYRKPQKPPGGLPGFSPASTHCKMTVATCLPNVAFSKLNCQWILTAAGLQIQSRPSSPQFQCCRQMQNHQKRKADPSNGTKACFGCPTIHFSLTACQPQHNLLLLSNCLPQIALEALLEHENTKKISGACPQTPPPSYIPFPPFVDSLICSENSNS